MANISSPWLVETVAFSLAFSTITTLHIVLGELAPKSLAIRKAVPTALWVPDEFGCQRREFHQVSANEFLVDGSLPIHEMRELAGLVWKDEDVTTVDGYIIHRLGYLPRAGDQLRIDGYIVTIEKADDRRIHQIRFKRLARTHTSRDGDDAIGM